MVNLDSVRHELAVLAKRRSARTLGWPHRWHPQQVINPEDGQPFTPTGAWEFIAELLEKGHSIEEVTLRHPPGKRAFVMLVTLSQQTLYVKLELGSGRILGRSFHYSERGQG